MVRVRLFWNLTEFCKMLTAKLKNNFDVIIVIDGNTGVGKSTLAVHLGKRTRNSTFHIRKDLIYSQDDFIKQMRKKWNQKIIADEMINAGFSRDWYSSKQKQIIKLMNMNRDHCNLIVLCVPNFADLDKKILNMCRIRITVIERGLAVVQMKNESIYSQDKWDILVNSKIERKALDKKKRMDLKDYTQLTTFAGFLRFPDLSPETKRLYREVKTQKRAKLYASEEEKLRLKRKTIDVRVEEALINGQIRNKKDFERVCSVAGVNYNTIYKKIRDRWKEQGVNRQLREFYVDNIVKQEMKKIEAKKETIEEAFNIDYAEELRKAREIKAKSK